MARKRGGGKMNCHNRISPRLEGTQIEAAVLFLSLRSFKRRRDGGELVRLRSRYGAIRVRVGSQGSPRNIFELRPIHTE